MSASPDVRSRNAASAVPVLLYLLLCLLVAPAALAQQAAPAAPAVPPPSAEAAAPEPTLEQKLEFLSKARITRSKQTKKGITAPSRLTLEDGVRTHDAVFQSVDEKKMDASFAGGRRELMFRDYWGYNVAAFKIAVLLGYPDLIPATVERTYRGRTGCVVWWVTGAFDQADIKEKGLTPPDALEYSRAIMRSRAFGALFGDTDRNLTNNLFTPEWRLVLIDFTRAFRLHTGIERPENLRGIDRRLFESMKTLTRENVQAAAGRYLTGPYIDALLKRRDALVEHFTKLIEQRGEAGVLYD
jgi:hypothetical protein